MDFQKGNIHNKGNKKDRIYLDSTRYLYPHQEAKHIFLDVDTMNPQLQVGSIISTATGKVPYDIGCNCFAGHTQNAKIKYPYHYRVRCHPIGYNYDNYKEGMDEGLHGFDYYVVDEILEP